MCQGVQIICALLYNTSKHAPPSRRLLVCRRKTRPKQTLSFRVVFGDGAVVILPAPPMQETHVLIMDFIHAITQHNIRQTRNESSWLWGISSFSSQYLRYRSLVTVLSVFTSTPRLLTGVVIAHQVKRLKIWIGCEECIESRRKTVWSIPYGKTVTGCYWWK